MKIYKQIQIDELTNPCIVRKTFYEKVSCSSYLVAVTAADGSQTPRFLQAFPAGQEDLCGDAQKALAAVFGSEKIRRYSFQETQYLLMQLPQEILQWSKELQQPMLQRLRCVSGFVDYLERMEQLGYLPRNIDPNTFIWLPDGTLGCWDLRNTLTIRDAQPQILDNYRRKCALDLTQLILQALIGSPSTKKNTLSLLKLALLGRMFPSDQKSLLQLLDNYLSQEKKTDIAPLKEKLGDVIAALEIDEWIHTNDKQGTVAVANFLHANPLWKYARDGQLNILMVGRSPIRKTFLDTILPCAQMLDTRMHIRIVSEDAAAFSANYLKKARLLTQAVEITHIPERPRRKYTLNEAITGKDRQGNIAPLASLTFEEAASPQAQNILDAHCILLLDDFTEQMRRALQHTVANRKMPLLIGLKDMIPRPDDLQVLGGDVVMDSFSVGRRDDLTRTRIYRDALGVHTYYEKDGDQCKSRQDILASFENKYYRDSSIRAALSIGYKLAAYGLADQADASRRFREEILCNPEKLQRLIWLEHRSWQAFMMVRGWSLDTNNLAQDFIRNGYDYKKYGVWHACLFGSNDTPTAPLVSWSTRDWLHKSVKSLDPLDTMSVITHRLLTDYVQTSIEPQIQPILNKLSTRLDTACFQQLDNVVAGLKANVTNAAEAWKRFTQELETQLQQASDPKTTEAQTLLEQLEKLMAVIIRRNKRPQYKTVDKAILEAIPYLLEKDSIRCVYKLWADQAHPWSNLASAFFMEPQQMILLTTPGQTIPQSRQQAFAQFLRKDRNIDTAITVLPLEELRVISKNAVLDVTGADTLQLLQVKAQLASIKVSVPLIHYKDGKLQMLEGECPLIHCYRCNQSLNTKEVMQITGAVVRGENETLPMQQLPQVNELWAVVQKIDHYNIFSDFLASFRDSWKVYPGRYANEDTWDPYCNKAEADEMGLLSLLDKLESARIIRPVQWNFPQVTAVNPYCQNSLNKLLTAYKKAEKNNRKHMKLSFLSEDPEALCVLELQSTTFHEKAQIVTENKKECVLFGSASSKRTLELSALIKALELMEQRGFIHRIKDKEMLSRKTEILTEPSGKQKEMQFLELRFQFADIPVMDCLTKAGNVLEALAYHTIRQMNVFDDVKLGVNILWNEDLAPGTPTQNEIDLVCTKGTRSYFISCKKRPDLKTDQITEIHYETTRFGINGTPILLTAAQEQTNQPAYVRALRMGVEIITVKDWGEQNSAAVIRERILEILEKTK